MAWVGVILLAGVLVAGSPSASLTPIVGLLLRRPPRGRQEFDPFKLGVRHDSNGKAYLIPTIVVQAELVVLQRVRIFLTPHSRFHGFHHTSRINKPGKVVTQLELGLI